MSQAPFDMIKVISSKKIDHVRIELDQIKWMEKKHPDSLQKISIDIWSFFQKKAHRGQTVDKPWTDLLGSWNGLLGSWKDLLGSWTGYPPATEIDHTI